VETLLEALRRLRPQSRKARQVVAQAQEYVQNHRERMRYDRFGEDPDFLEPLRGHNLGCFCSLDLPCHADVMLEFLYR
jgi:hypothetical protein